VTGALGVIGFCDRASQGGGAFVEKNDISKDDKKTPIKGRSMHRKSSLALISKKGGIGEMRMKKKILWIVVSSLIVLSLIIASCGPGEEEEAKVTEEGGQVITTKEEGEKELVEEEKIASPEGPKYGGIYTAAIGMDTSNWDASTGFDLMGFQISITNEPLMAGDWSKGPAGTGETDWQYGAVGDARMCIGQLAESYEIPDNETLIFHIRKGVKWWDKEPANGREFTAYDAAWNIQTQWDLPTGNFKAFFPPEERLISVEALDKYTVQLKVPLNTQGIHFWEDGQRCYMMLPELYPNQKDWRNALGTGAFMVKDYIPGSIITMERNPNYWQTNPCGPGKGDQLPYIDGLKFIIIPDLSSQMSAFRTGKIDGITVTWENFKELRSTMDYEFEYVQTYGANVLPTGREDKDLPFKDVRVRQAMNLAVDKVAILEDYYEGYGSLMGWPYYDTPAFKDLYIPLEDLPDNVQELVKGGNPEKAKQLLTEAGYPNGFKTSIYSSSSQATDFLSIIREQLLQVGIDMEIKQVEGSVAYGMERARTWEEMWYKATKQYFLPHYMFELRPESNDCASFFEDAKVRAVLATINKYLAVDDQAWRQDLRDITPYLLEQSIAIWLPVAYKYICWQPWIKNHYGAVQLGAMLPFHNCYYIWIDVDLRKAMGY
jgi:ABC-type transport system substrate-binding protein